MGLLGRSLDFESARRGSAPAPISWSSGLNLGDGVPGSEPAIGAARVFDVSKSASKPEVTGSQGRVPSLVADAGARGLESGFSDTLEVTGTFEAAALHARARCGHESLMATAFGEVNERQLFGFHALVLDAHWSQPLPDVEDRLS